MASRNMSTGQSPLHCHLKAEHLQWLCRVCIIAGDISPIDVITHLPVLCEDHDIPYIFVPSKEVIGACKHVFDIHKQHYGDLSEAAPI